MTKKTQRINKLIGYLLAVDYSSYSGLKKELGISDTELNKLLHFLLRLNIITKKGNRYYLSEYLKNPKIRNKLDDEVLKVLKLLSEVSGIPLSDYSSLKNNIEILINYLIK
jgi:hypothetical protein